MTQQLDFMQHPELLGLRVVRSLASGRPLSRHVHDSLCFGMVLQGHRVLSTAEGECSLCAGHPFVIGPGVPHAVQDAPGTRCLVFSLPQVGISALCDELGVDEPRFYRPVGEDPRFITAIHRLGECVEHGDLLGGADWLRSACGHVLVHLGGAHDVIARHHGAVERAKTVLEERFAGDLGLRELADEAGLSPGRLNRLFSRSVGIPPGEYRQHLRIRRAKELLAAGTSLVDVALETGYADQSHFTRAFVRIAGMTPGVYRRGVLPQARE